VIGNGDGAVVVAGVRNFRGLVIEIAVGIDAYKIVSDNPFDGSRVTFGGGFCPVSLAFLDVAFRLGLFGVLGLTDDHSEEKNRHN